MPVLLQAVEISPQGIHNALVLNEPKSISIDFLPKATGVSLPFSRMRPPSPNPSVMLFLVPRDKPPFDIVKANCKCVAEGNRFFKWKARQSEGTTSKPVPGIIVIPFSFACLSRRGKDSNTRYSPV